MRKQAVNLYPDNESEQERFLTALTSGLSREQAILALQDRGEIRNFPKYRALPWQPEFALRVMDSIRPSKHPLHEKGAFYCLDFSSVFAASAMLAIQEKPRRILDLCSAPGGKGIFAYRAFGPELLVCNEVIVKRVEVLKSNLERCRIERSVITSLDPSVWARAGKEAMDLLIVDAPCSGQSLLAKGDRAEGAFDQRNIGMCVSRQRRILGNAYHTVAPGGHLLYMTCTFAKEENERMMKWLMREYGDLEAVESPSMAAHQSAYADFPCYRLFPQDGIGAGAFSCLLRKAGNRPEELPELRARIRWRYGQEPAPPRPASDTAS